MGKRVKYLWMEVPEIILGGGGPRDFMANTISVEVEVKLCGDVVGFVTTLNVIIVFRLFKIFHLLYHRGNGLYLDIIGMQNMQA